MTAAEEEEPIDLCEPCEEQQQQQQQAPPLSTTGLTARTACASSAAAPQAAASVEAAETASAAAARALPFQSMVLRVQCQRGGGGGQAECSRRRKYKADGVHRSLSSLGPQQARMLIIRAEVATRGLYQHHTSGRGGSLRMVDRPWRR